MSSSTDREKVGAEHRIDLGQLEAVSEHALAPVLGTIVGNVIAEVLVEPGVELDTLNVLVTPESTSDEVDAFGIAVPDVLHVRAWALRDRPGE